MPHINNPIIQERKHQSFLLKGGKLSLPKVNLQSLLERRGMVWVKVSNEPMPMENQEGGDGQERCAMPGSWLREELRGWSRGQGDLFIRLPTALGLSADAG